MLVLSRKVGESVVIGHEVVVRVARVSRSAVSLAIEAPPDVAVDRKEVHLAKHRERRLAGDCETGKTAAGSGETGQVKSDCDVSGDGGSAGSSLVRMASPTLNRLSGKKCREEGPAKRGDHRGVLRPGVRPGGQPNASSLRAAVNRLIAERQACDGPEIEFWDDLAVGELQPELQRAVLSIVQELLLNACRHSESKNVLLGLAQDDGCLCVQVQDWGIGFDPQPDPPHGQGLKKLRDLIGWLGGTLDIDSHRGKGTCLIVEVPLSRETDLSDRATAPKPR
jgi:carbon storage regulator CsrA